jgi:hypothetical protein
MEVQFKEVSIWSQNYLWRVSVVLGGAHMCAKVVSNLANEFLAIFLSILKTWTAKGQNLNGQWLFLQYWYSSAIQPPVCFLSTDRSTTMQKTSFRHFVQYDSGCAK